MDFSDAPTLIGRDVTLVPLQLEHAQPLASVVAADGLDLLWYTRIPPPEGVLQDIGERLARQRAGEVAPWTIVRNADRQPVGMTTFLNIRADHRRLEIGSTWLARQAQGTTLNPEAKLLLLNRAFEVLNCIAVEFRTHWHNRRSRRAIEALGAKQDGVLRNHDLWRDGTRRDVVVYSIIDGEWPTVKLGLEHRLGRWQPATVQGAQAQIAGPPSAPSRG